MAKEITNDFSWSKTRDEVFRLCPRRYHYDYYASWGGWKEDAPPEVREAYVLKKLKTRRMWGGHLVHRAIERSLTNLVRGIPVLEADRIVEITLDLMRNEYRFSKRGNYRRAKGTGLLEHEYGLDVPAGEWQSLAADVEKCLRHFYASPIFGSIRSLSREDILEVEELSQFDFEGTRCWVTLDAAWREPSGLVIADWKTGQTEPGGHELQLAGYSLYASQRWGLAAESITLLEYNLLLDHLHRYRSDRATVERTRAYIRGSIADMKSLLADPGRNVPLPVERFARARDREACLPCNYRRVCRPEGA